MNTSKRNYLSIVSLVLIVLLVSTVMLVNSRKDSSVISSDNSKQTIDLVFKPVEIEPLKEVEITDEFKYVDTIELKCFNGSLHVYVKNDETESGEVYGFIEHNNKFYEVNVISAYGVEDQNINLVDVTKDGRKELQLIGSLGSTYAELKIISYDANDEQWINLLTMGTPYIVDLDGDGVNEYIGVSTGSMPGFVDIYRWNGEFFVKASVTESTNNIYANLYNNQVTSENKSIQDGSWIIETGNNDKSEFYRYELGKLVKTSQN